MLACLAISVRSGDGSNYKHDSILTIKCAILYQQVLQILVAPHELRLHRNTVVPYVDYV